MSPTACANGNRHRQIYFHRPVEVKVSKSGLILVNHIAYFISCMACYSCMLLIAKVILKYYFVLSTQCHTHKYTCLQLDNAH